MKNARLPMAWPKEIATSQMERDCIEASLDHRMYGLWFHSYVWGCMDVSVCMLSSASRETFLP